MKLTGDIGIRAPREKIFEALRDPQFFGSCIDGIKDLEAIDDTRYNAVLETRVAYLQFRFKVVVELTHIEAPSEIAAKIEGTPLGVAGRLTATTVTTLEQDGDTTRIHYDIETALTGKLGAMGQPVVKSKAKEMEKQFVARLRAAFEEAAPAEAQ